VEARVHCTGMALVLIICGRLMGSRCCLDFGTRQCHCFLINSCYFLFGLTLGRYCLGGVVIVNLVSFHKHVQDIVRAHTEVWTLQTAASGSGAGANITEDEVEGVEDGIDQINLGRGQRGEDSAGEVELGSEESSEEGGKELSNNDGCKDGKEEGEELGDLAQIKPRIILLGSSVLVTSSIIAGGSSVTIVGSTILYRRSSVPSLGSSVSGVCSTVRC